MDIEELFNTKTGILNNKLVYTFTFKNCEITELRIMNSVKCMKDILDTLFIDKVKNVCFVFVIDEITIPSNYKYFKDFTSVFDKYQEIIKEKVRFTIIQSNSNIFQLLFSVFKQYYKPIKPMYVCSNEEDVKNCLKSKKEREKFKNVSDMIS